LVELVSRMKFDSYLNLSNQAKNQQSNYD